MQHLPVGLVIEHLRIDGVLGSGGSGITYRASDLRNQKVVALKEYFPMGWSVRNPDGRVLVSNTQFEADFRHGLDCFIIEAETLARFSNAHIVKIERVFGAMGTAFIQLEHLAGPTVDAWLDHGYPQPSQSELDGFAGGLIKALATIHAAGILHCDIGPRNIVLRATGLPILIDFGSARRAVGELTGKNKIFVTPHYAPQEMYISTGGQRGPWTDIYAAAAVLYRLALGAPPPAAPVRAITGAKALPLDPRAHAQYRADFLSAIAWGLEFAPGSRPPNVYEWATTLLGSGNGRSSAGLQMFTSRNAPNRPS